jgi:hypothetical protein
VTQAIISKFVDFGVPMWFCSDNDPQFDAGKSQEALRRWGVIWGN